MVNSGNDFDGKTVKLASPSAIDLSSHYWVPIAQYFPPNESAGQTETQPKFQGIFDGNKQTVKGLTIGGPGYANGTPDHNNTTPNEGNALFGTLGKNGVVINLDMSDVDIATYRRGAAIAGFNYGTIEYSKSSGSIRANGGGSDRGTGGIVGTNYGLVHYCYSTADVYNAYRRAGGIVGYNSVDHDAIGKIQYSWFAGYAHSASPG
jgi:hypothetical protein